MVTLAHTAEIFVGATPDPRAAGKARYLRQSDVLPGAIARIWGVEAGVPSRGRDTSLIEGDVVVRARGGVPVAAIVQADHAHAFATTELCVVRPDSSRLASSFLAAFLNSPDAQNQLAAGWQGSAHTRLTVAALARLDLPTLPLATQELIGGVAADAFLELDLLERLRELRGQLRQKLLHRLMEKARAESANSQRGLITGPVASNGSGPSSHRSR